MKRNSTLLILALCLLTFAPLAAQNVNVVRITVDHPSVDWIIDGLQANFGGDINLTGPYDGVPVWVTDGVTEPTDGDEWTKIGRYGCEELINGDEINGNIAFISRGACEFGVKLLNAQKQGATAGIIGNRAPLGVAVGSHTPGLVWMAPGSVGDSVRIPGVFITFEDRDHIGNLIDAGEDFTISIQAPYIQDVAAAYSYKTPMEQVVPLEDIRMVVMNRDTLPLMDVTIKAVVTDPSGASTELLAEEVTIFDGDNTNFPLVDGVIDTIMPAITFDGFSGEHIFEFPSYTPTMVGEYTVTFTASTPAGDHPIDAESESVSFMIGDDHTYAQDHGPIVNPNGLPMHWRAYQDSLFVYNVGSTFRTGSNGATVTYASFGLANPGDLTPGMEFAARIYLMDDADGDGVVGNTFPETMVAEAIYELTGSETPNQPIYVQFDPPVSLDPDAIYLLMIEHDGLLADNFVSPAFTYAGGMNTADYGTVYQLGRAGYNADGWEYWNDDTPGMPHGGRHVMVRIHTEGFVISSVEEALADNKVRLSPNPVTDVLHLDLQLDRIADEVQVSITDVLGNLVRFEQFQGVQSGRFEISAQDFANGAYFLNIRTPEGSRTLKFVVAR